MCWFISILVWSGSCWELRRVEANQPELYHQREAAAPKTNVIPTHINKGLICKIANRFFKKAWDCCLNEADVQDPCFSALPSTLGARLSSKQFYCEPITFVWSLIEWQIREQPRFDLLLSSVVVKSSSSRPFFWLCYVVRIQIQSCLPLRVGGRWVWGWEGARRTRDSVCKMPHCSSCPELFPRSTTMLKNTDRS